MEIPADRAERCDVSLVTGAVRTLGVDAEQQCLADADGQILQRDQLLTVANTAGTNKGFFTLIDCNFDSDCFQFMVHLHCLTPIPRPMLIQTECAQTNRNLHWSGSRFSVNTSEHYHRTQFHQHWFVSVSYNVNTQLNRLCSHYRIQFRS